MEEISAGFVTELPQTIRKHDSLILVISALTKVIPGNTNLEYLSQINNKPHTHYSILLITTNAIV